MKKIFAALAALAITLTGCSAAAEENSGPAVVTANGYARATDMMSEMNGMLMTGVFMDITNNSGSDLTLIGGSTAIAERLEVHEVVAGVMRKKEGGLTIAAGQTQMLKPGGNHIMLVGLNGQLAAGTEVSLTLEFSNGDKVDVTVPVKVVNLEQEHYDSGSPSPSMEMGE